MIEAPRFFDAPDGTRLAYRDQGVGRPLLLVHGFLSSGTANWLGHRRAQQLVDRGFRLVVPDLRGHGRSPLPHDPAACPPDVLVDDTLALLGHLGIDDLDAAGYSLGARVVTRMLVRGTPIRRAVIGGQGLEALTQPAGEARTSFARVALAAEGPKNLVQEWFAQQWRRRSTDDQQALRRLLASSIGTSNAQLRAISTPTLVVMGERDDPADGRALAGTLGDGRFTTIAGDHVRAAGEPGLFTAVADFLDDPGVPGPLY